MADPKKLIIAGAAVLPLMGMAARADEVETPACVEVFNASAQAIASKMVRSGFNDKLIRSVTPDILGGMQETLPQAADQEMYRDRQVVIDKFKAITNKGRFDAPSDMLPASRALVQSITDEKSFAKAYFGVGVNVQAEAATTAEAIVKYKEMPAPHCK